LFDQLCFYQTIFGRNFFKTVFTEPATDVQTVGDVWMMSVAETANKTTKQFASLKNEEKWKK
jgi:hypothetical protein